MKRFLPILIGSFMAALLACSGGGGSDGGSSTGTNPGGGSNPPLPTMSLSTTQVSVTAALAGSAPSATVKINVAGTYSGGLYALYKNTSTCIQSVSMDSGAASSATVTIQFKSPGILGVGTYTDTLQLGVSTDSAGTTMIQDSPQVVAVTMVVTPFPPPTLTALSPSTAFAGGSAFTLTANGTQFTAQSSLLWNGSPRATTFVSSTKLTAQILASDLATAGTVPVTISNGAGNGASSAIAFTVTVPVFTLTAVAPSSIQMGSPGLTLTVNGAQFQSASVVQWNGSPRATTYVSAFQLTAQIPASDLVAAGTFPVSVVNPAGQGGTSNAVPFAVTAPDAVASQINAAHTGSIQFNTFALPAASAWTATLDGPPSYPLIAQGNVYVTVAVAGASELVALSQATGKIVWGPLAVPGSANAVYDNGQIFVLSASAASNGIIQAYDAANGTPKWSAALPGYGGGGAPPVAFGGIVYALPWSGGVNAYNETNGALLWTGRGQNGSPAVTATAVYTTFTDTAIAMNPATGAILWQDNLGGSGGGGATPVVANGRVYAPDGFGTYDGQILDADTGALLGSYAAQNMPAIGSDVGYFLQGGTLRAIKLSNNQILWSFAGDGTLVTSPLLVNNVVFIGSSSGNLYGLDATTGAQLWTRNLGHGLPAGSGWLSSFPVSGMGAGDGMLVVPAGNTLVAFNLTPNP